MTLASHRLSRVFGRLAAAVALTAALVADMVAAAKDGQDL